MQRKFTSVQKLSMRDCSQLESMSGYGGTMAAANLCVPAFVCFTTSVELPSETTIIRTHQINDHTFIEGKWTLLRPPLACLMYTVTNTTSRHAQTAYIYIDDPRTRNHLNQPDISKLWQPAGNYKQTAFVHSIFVHM